MPELIPAAPGSPDWLAARPASVSMTTLSLALCAIEDWLREQPARHADEMADRVHDAWLIVDDLADAEIAPMGPPPPPEWPALKLTPWSRLGLIHGAYDAAMPPLQRRGFHEPYAGSWMYRRGFARGFLLAKEAARG